jgi:hypothetical protein
LKALADLAGQIRSAPLISANNAWAFARLAVLLRPGLKPRHQVIVFLAAKLAEDIARLFDDAVEGPLAPQLQICSDCLQQGLQGASISPGQGWVEPFARAIDVLASLPR